MDSILYYKLLITVVPLIFIIGGTYLIITKWKNKISIIISSLLVLIGGYDLTNNLFKSPNLVESKTYYDNFENLVVSDIEKIVVTSEFISEEFKKNSKEITDKNQIKKIFEFMKLNHSKSFEFKDWSPESCYDLKYVTRKKSIYKFHVCESMDERSYIDILYPQNEKFIKVGQYRNDFIKRLKILKIK